MSWISRDCKYFGKKKKKKKKKKDVFKCLWFEMNMKLILWLSLWMTSALSNSLEITNMHVQGVSWIFVKFKLSVHITENFEHVSTITGLHFATQPKKKQHLISSFSLEIHWLVSEIHMLFPTCANTLRVSRQRKPVGDLLMFNREDRTLTSCKNTI